MGECAVPAPDREVVRTDNDIMRASDMTVPAGSVLDQLPDRILPDFRERSCCIHIFNTRYEDPGCSAIIAGNLCLVRDCLDNLVCNLCAMITIGTIFREDEPVAHGRYWMPTGSLICCPSGIPLQGKQTWISLSGSRKKPAGYERRSFKYGENVGDLSVRKEIGALGEKERKTEK